MADIWVSHTGSDANDGLGSGDDHAVRTIEKATTLMTDSNCVIRMKDDQDWLLECRAVGITGNCQAVTADVFYTGGEVEIQQSWIDDNKCLWFEAKVGVLDSLYGFRMIQKISTYAVQVDRPIVNQDVNDIEWAVGDVVRPRTAGSGFNGNCDRSITFNVAGAGSGEYRLLTSTDDLHRATFKAGTNCTATNMVDVGGGGNDNLLITSLIMDGQDAVSLMQAIGYNVESSWLFRYLGNCLIHNLAAGSAVVSTDVDCGLYIEGCEIHHCKHGVNAADVAINNVVHDLANNLDCNGILARRLAMGNLIYNLTAGGPGSCRGLILCYEQDVCMFNTIYNVVAAGFGSAMGIVAQGTGDSHGVVENNIISGADIGLDIASGFVGRAVFNCFHNVSTQINGTAILTSNNITDDPLFKDAANGDFEPGLQSVREGGFGRWPRGAVVPGRSGGCGQMVGSPISGAF